MGGRTKLHIIPNDPNLLPGQEITEEFIDTIKRTAVADGIAGTDQFRKVLRLLEHNIGMRAFAVRNPALGTLLAPESSVVGCS